MLTVFSLESRSVPSTSILAWTVAWHISRMQKLRELRTCWFAVLRNENSPGRVPDLKTTLLYAGSLLPPNCWYPVVNGAIRHRLPAPPQRGRELSLLLCAAPLRHSPHAAAETGREPRKSEETAGGMRTKVQYKMKKERQCITWWTEASSTLQSKFKLWTTALCKCAGLEIDYRTVKSV